MKKRKIVVTVWEGYLVMMISKIVGETKVKIKTIKKNKKSMRK